MGATKGQRWGIHGTEAPDEEREGVKIEVDTRPAEDKRKESAF